MYNFLVHLCKFGIRKITDFSSTFPRHTEFETSADVKKSTIIEVRNAYIPYNYTIIFIA